MGIYVFNLLVGYSPNGVDNAQGYRAQMLKNYPLTYIFTDLPERIYINQYQNVGISIKQMLSIHHFFTDNRSLELSGQVSAKLEELKEILRYTHTIHSNCEIRLYRDNMKIASILLDEARPDYYYGIHYFKNENLVRTEMYTNGMAYANFYVTASDNNKPYAKLTRRTFYNKDGSVAYCQVFEDENERYFFPDGSLLTKQQLIADFIQKLCLTEQDILLIDRPA